MKTTSKNIIIIMLCSILIFVQNLSAFAQVPPIFFLNQAISSAIQNDPFIQRKRAEMGLSPSEVAAISTSQLNPFFTFGLAPGAQGYEFGFAKTFEFGGLRTKRIEIANLRNELKMLELKQQILAIKDKVRGAYVTHYINHSTLKDLEKSLEQLTELHSSHCCLNSVEQKQSELILLKLKNDIQIAKLSLLESRINLEELTGKPIDDAEDIEAPNEIPDGLSEIFGEHFSDIEKQNQKSLERIAYENRPEVEENKKEIELSLKQEHLAKVKRLPLVIFESGWTLDTPAGYNENNFYIDMDIELPILYRNQDEIRASQERKKQYEENLLETKHDISIEIKNTYEYMIQAKKNLDIYETKTLKESEELFEFFIEKYKSGDYYFSELIQAKEINSEIKKGYYQALRNYQDSISDLERVLGVGNSEEETNGKSKYIYK